MGLESESQRGNEAKSLLDNPLYQECVQSLREAIISKWRSTPIRDREGAHELKLMDKLLSDIEQYFKTIAETGKIADIQIERERKMERLKKAGIHA
jgi:hypothetical protein